MAIVLTGSIQPSGDAAPHLKAATLTALFALAPEQLTVGQLRQLLDTIERAPGGSHPSDTLGAIVKRMTGAYLAIAGASNAAASAPSGDLTIT